MRLSAKFSNLSELQVKNYAVPLLILLGVTATFASVSWIRGTSARPNVVSVNKVVAQQAELIQTRNTLEIQRITLRPTGFEPAEVTRPAGRFLLAINDRSGQRDTSFTLMRVSGERLKEVRMRDQPRKHEWREVVTLPPGRYVLSDAANPERVCQILLTN